MINNKQTGIKGDKLGGSGEGWAVLTSWLSKEASVPNLKMLKTIALAPGATVSDHAHTGEAEIYRIVSGIGEYNDNGKTVTVHEGDTTLCSSGESHGLKNIGEDELVFDAVIITE